jgi:hypothetical protein
MKNLFALIIFFFVTISGYSQITLDNNLHSNSLGVFYHGNDTVDIFWKSSFKFDEGKVVHTLAVINSEKINNVTFNLIYGISADLSNNISNSQLGAYLAFYVGNDRLLIGFNNIYGNNALNNRGNLSLMIKMF